MRRGTLAAFLVAASLGAPLPGAGSTAAPKAIRWTPAALSTGQYESSPTFSPDGREMFFFRGDPTFSRYRLFESRCVDGRWSTSSAPAFAAPENVDEADPAFTADGSRLYFVSTRGDPRARDVADLDIWFVDRDAHGRWSEPARLPEPVNSPGAELLPRPQPDGSLVFGSDRPGGVGGHDIYVAFPEKSGWRVENPGSPVNTRHHEYEAELSRDGKLLMVIADRGDHSHLYPYRREGSKWMAQPRIVPRLDVFQVGPLLSPLGDRLLFAQADGADSGEWFLLDLAGNPDRRWPPACDR